MLLADWSNQALPAAASQLQPNDEVRRSLERCFQGCLTQSVHLAVLVEPYLEFVIKGSKTVESRFSSTKTAPYCSVSAGDIILLKAAAGPVVGVCTVAETWYFANPSGSTMADLRRRFGPSLRDDVPGFWDERAHASYITLLGLVDVRKLARPIPCPKRDRRGWVVLRPRLEQMSMY